jgi:hypothetical protein
MTCLYLPGRTEENHKKQLSLEQSPALNRHSITWRTYQWPISNWKHIYILLYVLNCITFTFVIQNIFKEYKRNLFDALSSKCQLNERIIIISIARIKSTEVYSLYWDVNFVRKYGIIQWNVTHWNRWLNLVTCLDFSLLVWNMWQLNKNIGHKDAHHLTS